MHIWFCEVDLLNLSQYRRIWNFAPIVLLPALVVAVLNSTIESNQQVYQHLEQQIQDNYIETTKMRIRGQVDRAVDIIVDRQIALQDELRQQLKLKADNSYNLLSNLRQSMTAPESETSRQRLIKALQAANTPSNSEQIWLIDRQTAELLMAPYEYQNKLGQSVMGLTDSLGKNYIEEELQFLQRNTQGFLSSRVESKMNDMVYYDTRLSYVRRLPGGDWYIAVRADLKKSINKEYRELLQLFQQASMNQPDYFFIFDKKGNLLMNMVRNDLVGKNIFEVDDEKAQAIFQNLLSDSQRPRHEFSSYHWLNPATGIEEPKLSYLQPVPNLDWVIGKGFYPQTLSPQFELQKQRLQQEYRAQSEFVESLQWALGLAALLLGTLLTLLLERSQRRCIEEKNATIGELKKQNIVLENQVLVKGEEIRQLKLDLMNNSIIDPQTQIASRSALFMRLRDEAHRCARFNHGFSALIFTVDDFNSWHDKFNESLIETLLQELTTIVFNQIRALDLFGRFDEQHFMVILPQTDGESLQQSAMRIQDKVAEHPFAQQIKMTLSIGAAEFAANQSVSEFVVLLERNLEHAKDQGSNGLFINSSAV